MLADLGVTHAFGPEVENKKHLTPAEYVTKVSEWLRVTKDLGLKVILKQPLAPVPEHCVGFCLDVDEPNGKGITADKLKANHDALRALDPSMPIFLSLAGDKVSSANFKKKADGTYERPWEPQAYVDFGAYCDAFTINCYSANRNASRYAMTWTGDTVKKLAEATGKPVWAWIEHNDQRLPDPKPADGINREPTPQEIEDTVVYAIACGAKGIGWFSTCDSGKYGWPASYWPLVNRFGASMQPQIDKLKSLALTINPPQIPDTEPPDEVLPFADVEFVEKFEVDVLPDEVLMKFHDEEDALEFQAWWDNSGAVEFAKHLKAIAA
jgi:hypothetical protein